ncbi:hypothetical protein JCM19233_5939 [Vibrio astriarenae]|nr:hypothetical protein JCM19233_5939 [Vibrio sp. C7]
MSLSEICTAEYGYSNAAWCDINQFGGTYTVSANSNSALVDILISNVDSEVIWALANQLAPLSAERCQRMQSCGTIQASGTNITVTM